MVIFGLAGVLIWYFLYSRDGVKEPWYAVFEAFGFGLIAVVIALILETVLIPNNGQILSDVLTPSLLGVVRLSLLIAITEEAAKFLPLALFIHRRSYFNRVADGVIYFALAGLAFGVIENMLYVWRFGASVGLYRALILVFFHAATAGIIGYYFALTKIERKSLTQTFIALAIVTLVHALYDAGLILGYPITVAISLAVTILLNVTLFVFYKKARDYDMKKGLIASRQTQPTIPNSAQL